jgi:hypothetical protein
MGGTPRQLSEHMAGQSDAALHHHPKDQRRPDGPIRVRPERH